MWLSSKNRYKLQEIILDIDPNSFIYSLRPYELMYLKNQNLTMIINGSINELIEKEIIEASDDDSTLKLLDKEQYNLSNEG